MENEYTSKPLNKKIIIILALGAIITLASPFLVLCFDFIQYNNQIHLDKFIDMVHHSIFKLESRQ
jgi:hypothetical protein